MKTNIIVKSAIAVAIAAATTATTIADTKLYGRFRAGLVCTDSALGGDDDTDCGFENRSSRFGIKVDQPISDSLTAFGKYEFGVNLDEGALSNGENSNRLAYVGVKGGFGEVSIGTRWSPMYSYVMSPVDAFDLLGGTSGNSLYEAGFRKSDTLNYKNKFGPASMHLQVQMDDGDAGNDTVDEFQIGGGMTAGPVNLGLAYQDVNDAGSRVGLHAGGKFGIANLGLSVFLFDSDSDASDANVYHGLVGFGLSNGQSVNLGLGYADLDTADANPFVISAEYKKKMSKNFSWFAAVQNADWDVDGVDDTTKYGAGMRLDF